MVAAAVLAVVVGGAHAENACWWTQANICRLRSSSMMPELRTALSTKLNRNAMCVSHTSENGCAGGAPDNCKSFKLTSLADDESAVVCADASAQFESLEDYKTAVEAGPAFQELCFTADGYVTWACMRDLQLLSKLLGCSGACSANVLTVEKMHQACTSAKDADSCTVTASESAKTIAVNDAIAALPTEPVPRPDAEKVIRTLAGSYGGYAPPPPSPSPPLNSIESGFASPTPIGAASPISFGLSVLGAAMVGVVMLAF